MNWKINRILTNYWFAYHYYLFFFQLQFYKISSLSPLWDSVTTNIHQEYDVEEGNDILTVRVNMGEYISTDLVVGEDDIRADSRLILTCIAHHGPAEWVYSGDGNPNFIKNKTTENFSPSGKRLKIDDMNGAKRYIATLTLGSSSGMTTMDTGRYNCMTASPETGMQYKTLSAFYHVYVPAKNRLFIRKSETIYYDLNKSAARIPCGVSNPKAFVTLQKVTKDTLEFIPNDSMLYHPISGYYPKKDIKGTYFCTAAYNNTFDSVHFTLAPMSTYQTDQKVSKKPTSSSKNKPSRHTKPMQDNNEWLMYPTTKLTTTSHQRIQSLSSTTTKKVNLSPYIPFHLRYSTTTYQPFQTFFTVQTTTERYKPTSATVKTKPFNPSNYPSELFIQQTKPHSKEKNQNDYSSDSDSSSNDLPFPSNLISYRPILNHIKNPSSSNNKTMFQIFNSKQRPPIIIQEKLTTSYVRNTRTTPRKYHTYTMPTTEIPVKIPESIICSQFNCGIKAICFASMVYNRTLKKLIPEPSCKCIPPNHLGNAFLECYAPTQMMDPNLLLFNLSSFGRSPHLEENVYSNSKSGEESESAESVMIDSDSDDDDDDEDDQDDEQGQGRRRKNTSSSVGIIDM